MLILLSPSKTQNPARDDSTLSGEEPLFLDKRWGLVTELQKADKQHLMELMRISEKLADENLARIKNWTKSHNNDNAKPALQAFTGAVYKDFEALKFSKTESKYAQKHVRTLSGLYGILCGMDLMQPYRLEMGTRGSFKVGDTEYKNLYDYWKSDITDAVKNDPESDVILNLASLEYSRVIDQKQLSDTRWMDVEFYQESDGELKQVTIYTKTERGAMAAWMMREGVTDLEHIKKYNQNGYRYAKDLSKENILVFVRNNK